MQPPPNHVAMMQIDCEVMNTRLLHIREDAIPIHMSAQLRHTTAVHSNESLDNEDAVEDPVVPVEQARGSNRSVHTFGEDNLVVDGIENEVYSPESVRRGAWKADSRKRVDRTPLYNRRRSNRA